MDLPRLASGSFIRRDNRFRATVRVNGQITSAHVPNSGRLTELFLPGRPVWLAPAEDLSRKTKYDLKLVEIGSILVSADARLPNGLVAEALSAGKLPDLKAREIRREVSYGNSRLDLRLSGPLGTCWVETKSVTLVVNGEARFPDAPTDRGRRHLGELIQAINLGDQAAVLFIVQRPDATRFSPHVEADPRFAAALKQAAAAGVSVRAFRCRVSLAEISLDDEIPVFLQ